MMAICGDANGSYVAMLYIFVKKIEMVMMVVITIIVVMSSKNDDVYVIVMVNMRITSSSDGK